MKETSKDYTLRRLNRFQQLTALACNWIERFWDLKWRNPDRVSHYSDGILFSWNLGTIEAITIMVKFNVIEFNWFDEVEGLEIATFKHEEFDPSFLKQFENKLLDTLK